MMHMLFSVFSLLWSKLLFSSFGGLEVFRYIQRCNRDFISI